MTTRKFVTALVAAGLALGATTVTAGSDELGAALVLGGSGAVIGHAIDGRDGAVIGGFLGAILGAAAAHDDDDNYRRRDRDYRDYRNDHYRGSPPVYSLPPHFRGDGYWRDRPSKDRWNDRDWRDNDHSWRDNDRREGPTRTRQRPVIRRNERHLLAPEVALHAIKPGRSAFNP
jgi:hypothetical protein